MQIGKIIRQD